VVYTQTGIASWYGSKFHGRKTASGERYNMYGVSAAHRTLPLGTVVRVTHRGNGKRLTVRINDRGPFVKGRIIDLSYGAARKLDMVKEGVAEVLLEAFGTEEVSLAATAKAFYSVQAGSFLLRRNAEQLKISLDRDFEDVSIHGFQDAEDTYFRVRVGRYDSESEARKMAGTLERAGYSGFVVRVD
jgi:rare lipoprotein A